MDSTQQQDIRVEPEVLSPALVFTPQTLIVATLSVAVVLLTIFIIISRSRATAKKDSVLFVGPLDAGKTAILSTLAYNETLPTHTSMQPNAVVVPVELKTMRIVDIPGHPRIRDQFREYLPDAKAIVFLVDSSTVSRIGPAVAEHLHHVLYAVMSLPPSHTTPALLIVAHKCDLLKPTAQATPEQLAINRVRTILERELDRRRVAQTGGMTIEGLGAEGAESELGGLECSGSGEFRFDNWEGGEIAFVGTSVHIGKSTATSSDEKAPQKDGLSSLRRWLVEQL